MLDRESELDAFKRVDLSVIASSFGFAVETKRTTKKTVMMSKGSEKIAISYNGRHYVFWAVGNDGRSGTVIDFIQKVVEPGSNMGQVRQLLRPFLNASYLSEVRHRYQGRYASEIKANEVDLEAVARRYANFLPITQPHPFLCDVRSVPFELLQSKRLLGTLRYCPRRGSVIFPHYGSPTEAVSTERTLVGYEIKGPGVTMFSAGSRKGLWMSAAMKNDQRLAIGESGLDIVSYLAICGSERTRIASVAGRMNPHQPHLVRSAIERMGEGSQIIACFDNDEAGDELTEKLAKIVSNIGRGDLVFKDERPPVRGWDWNKTLMEQAQSAVRRPAIAPSFQH